MFCSAGRLLKVNAGFWWGWGITWNVLEPSSRTVTEQTQLPAPCSDRWWHFFNLLSNHVLFKQNPVLSHFVLKFICRFVCLNPLSLFRKWRGARGLCRGLRSALTSRVCIVRGQLCCVVLLVCRPKCRDNFKIIGISLSPPNDQVCVALCILLLRWQILASVTGVVGLWCHSL